MPLKFWDEAFQAATYLINRVPSRIINNNTPLERLYNQQPDYSALRTFGCACWPHLRPYNSRKLEFRSKRCVYLGVSDMHKGFKCLDITTGQVYISRDVIFDESIYPFRDLHSNVGAKLRSEIINLSPSLLNPTYLGTTVGDRMTNSDPECTNDLHEVSGTSPGENLEENPVQNGAGTQNTGHTEDTNDNARS